MTAVPVRARLLAVDDDRPFLALLRIVVGATDRLETVGEAECGEQAVLAASELRPDIVLMDVRMPGLGGINAAEQIKASWPSTLVILISTSHPDELGLETDETFADAVIWKSELEPDLLDQLWLGHRPLSDSDALHDRRQCPE